jgi:hypothetical protein
MHLFKIWFQTKWSSVAFFLTLATLWLCLHGYHGLTGDGQIYAFQAFAKLHPALASDLYLQNTSQDQFTLFPTFYAWCISEFGLEGASRLLTMLFTFWILAATWSFVSAIAGREAAWLAVAGLLIVTGDYGGAGVFQILDPFLTARLPAEALIITALSCYFRGMKWFGGFLALLTLFVHPLMALPGLLLIVWLSLPLRATLASAFGGVSTTLCLATVAANVPATSHWLPVMDAPWLDVVRERSQFLFLQLWSLQDWQVNALPLISLTLTFLVVADERIRRLCAMAILIGTAGFAVSFIGGAIGPVAILVQGQAWRWIWVTIFISVVLAPFTILQILRNKQCGHLAALLLTCAWTLPAATGTACVIMASVVWLFRERIAPRFTSYLRLLSCALGAAMVVFVLVKWSTIATPSMSMSALATRLKQMFGLQLAAAMLVALVRWATLANRASWLPLFLTAALSAASVFILPVAFKQSRTLGASADIDEFADWTKDIPPTSTVLVAPSRDVGAFVWFTLRRPNYLAVDQSSGVVFSRATALEVQRRSAILSPLMEPNWKIMSALRRKSNVPKADQTGTRPLTEEKLVQVCADPLLGFIISPEKVRPDFSPHVQSGIWKGWNLYDCGKVRTVAVTK